jgi:hypothetical protein
VTALFGVLIHRRTPGTPVMTQTHRFGRRIPLPATIQILHELLALSAHEDASNQRVKDDGITKTTVGQAPKFDPTAAPEPAFPRRAQAAGARSHVPLP